MEGWWVCVSRVLSSLRNSRVGTTWGSKRDNSPNSPLLSSHACDIGLFSLTKDKPSRMPIKWGIIWEYELRSMESMEALDSLFTLEMLSSYRLRYSDDYYDTYFDGPKRGSISIVGIHGFDDPIRRLHL